MKKIIIVGVSSGIAAYKVLDLIMLLRNSGDEVFVTMTDHAQKMIAKREFAQVSGNPVATILYPKNFDYKKVLQERIVDHIALADKCEVMIIAPATANIIAKLAHGIADDYLTTTALAVTAPIIICPSMNVNMWHNSIVQENINKLVQSGYHIIHPEKGMLACGYEGVGRLAEVTTIKKEIDHLFKKATSLKGKKILVTAGGTSEKIDNIRSITNRSSGKMGVSIAEVCFDRGADVLLLRAKSAQSPRYHINEQVYTTTDELLALIKKYASTYDYLYHTAAVSDFRVVNKHTGKIKSDTRVTLELEPQIKILDQIKLLHPQIKLIAFKAEYTSNKKNLLHVAFNRMQESRADAIIANDVSRLDSGFEVDSNEVDILTPDGKTFHIPLANKKEVAEKIVDYLTPLFA